MSSPEDPIESKPVEEAPVSLAPSAAAPAPATAVTPLIAAAITTAAVTAVSYLAPDRYAATLVGVTFLAATWWLVLRHDAATVREFGLSMGGLLEPRKLDARHLGLSTLTALGWLLLLGVLVFPLFWLGYYWWMRWVGAISHHAHFILRWPKSVVDELAGQVVVIALPEEAFFRGYLQTALDRAWPPRWRILGAQLGPGWLVASAIFAVGHVLTIRHPARLAVFFPALVFGWLRARTGGVGASVAFHASCNLLSALLGRGYGLSG